MLIGLINELVTINESNKEEAEKILMQLFLHEDEYKSLCNRLTSYLVEKRNAC